MIKATSKQLAFINKIENLVNSKFDGVSSYDANLYIKQNLQAYNFEVKKQNLITQINSSLSYLDEQINRLSL